MEEKLSQKEWEQISEYLDGQMTSRQKTDFENRLLSLPILKSGLEEMRLTQNLLRSTPRRKIPHNFTLTRAQIQETRKTGSLFQVFGFSSALSFVLLILSLIVFRSPIQTPMMASAPSAQEAFVVETQTSGKTVPEIIIWGDASSINPPALGKGGGPPAPASLMVEKQGEIPIDLSPEMPLGTATPLWTMPEPSAAEAGEIVPPESPSQPEGKPGAPSVPSEIPIPTPGSPLIQDGIEDNGPILGIRPSEERGEFLLTPAVSSPGFTLEERVSFSSRVFVPIILGIAALIFAFAALITKNKTLH